MVEFGKGQVRRHLVEVYISLRSLGGELAVTSQAKADFLPHVFSQKMKTQEPERLCHHHRRRGKETSEGNQH